MAAFTFSHRRSVEAMEASLTRHLVDKLHDLLKEYVTDEGLVHHLGKIGKLAYEADEEPLYSLVNPVQTGNETITGEEIVGVLDQQISLGRSRVTCFMRRIKFAKTFLFCPDWSGSKDLTYQFDKAIRCLRIFQSEIPVVLEHRKAHSLFLLYDLFPTTTSLCQSTQLLYGRLENTPNSVVFFDVDVFDEFAASVQEYLVDAPIKPLGWLNFGSDYGEVEANYTVTLQQLGRFRNLLCNFSWQKKLPTLLGQAASVLFGILHIAYKIDSYRALADTKLQEDIIRSSSDMAHKLLPQNPDAMEVYLEALIAQVKIIKASKPSSSRHSRAESFFNLLLSAQNQVQLVGEIMDLPIMDLEINEQVEIWLKRGYAVVVREALAGSLCNPDPNNVALSNLLHKLHLIKNQLFILDLHTHKATLTTLGSLATVRRACKSLSLLFQTPRPCLEGIDKLILALIDSSLTETISYCGSYFSNPVSEDLILESSVAIFKLFKAEIKVMLLIDSTSCFKFAAEFGTTYGKLGSEAESFLCTTEMNQSNGRLMGVYEQHLEALSANVKASTQSPGPFHSIIKSFCIQSSGPFYSIIKSFRSFRQPVHNQGHILDFSIMYLIVDNLDDHYELVEILLKEFAVIPKEARPLSPSSPYHAALLNLLKKLNLIKAGMLVLELHSHKYSLCYAGEHRVPIKEALISLSQFFETQEVHTEGIEKLFLVLLKAFLREAGSLCDSHQMKQFSEAMIMETSLAIFRLFKAEALLMFLSLVSTSRLKFLTEFHIETLHKSLTFLRHSLSNPTKGSLKDANTVSETMAAAFVFSFEDSNRELDQSMQIRERPSQGPRSLSNNFPKSDGVVFVDHMLGKLIKLVTNKPDTFAFMKDEIDSLLKMLRFFISYLKDAKRVAGKNNTLELQVTWLTYDAEYIIEMFLCGDVPLCYLQLLLFITVEEMKDIKVQIKDNCHDNESYELPIQDVQLTLASEVSEGSNLRTDEVIVGLDAQAKIVVDLLQTGSKNLQVISIAGMPGIGKTTLAKKVYTDFSIQYHFQVYARCYVSQVYRKRELLLEILGDLLTVTDDIKKRDDNDLALLIKQKLHGKRYLIVVDDVWSMEHWDDLKLSFPDDNKGSRILFTTRNHDVARKAGPEREPYVLHLLSPTQSWDLLRVKLFQGRECPEQLFEAGRLVAEQCRGLPLAIVVMAGILKRMQMNKREWEVIAEHMRSQIADDEELHFMDILEFSYNHLPSYLKPCYLYLGTFLEDQEIPVKKLLWLWMGEGFIPESDCKSLEETAEGYLLELINRSLVMETKASSLGGTKTCRIHDMFRDLCLKKAKEENSMQFISMDDLNGSDSRVGKGYRLCVHSSKQSLIQLKPSAPNVHSLLFFDTDNTLENKSYDISSIVQDFKLVRVLDLEPITASIFPSGTGSLLFLSYLAIKGNIKSVPASISKLWNLETLIVKGTMGDIALPSSLWSMEMLRNVHVRPQATLTLSSPELDNFMVLENLTTISSPVLRDGIATEKILERWIRLTKLRCTFMQYWDSNRECSVFPSLELLVKLESLNLYNGGRSLPAEVTFPLNLKKLTLTRFCFPWDHISVISELSNLVVLKLLFRAFVGDTWEMNGESFPKLKFLKLENLNLANWNTTLDCVDHFPELERLVLRNCNKLGEVPSSFGEVLSLKMIEVNWCSQSAAKSMEKIMDQQLDFDNRDFKLMITPSEWDFRISS